MSRYVLWLFIMLAYTANAKECADSLTIIDIRINGNNRTRPAIIFREMTIEVGQTRSRPDLEEQLEQSRGNIMRTNLFIWVEHKIDSINSKEVLIEFTVKERLYLMVLPIFDLADRNFNEWWYNRNHDLKRVIYGLQLNHDNLTGNADELRLKTFGGFIPYFELSYSRPYIDKAQRVGVRGGVFYSIQKDFAYRTWEDELDFLNTEAISQRRIGGFAQIKFRQGLYNFFSFYTGYTSMWVSDVVLAKNPTYFIQNKNTLGYWTMDWGYSFDRRDNAYYPLHGKVLRLNLTQYHYDNLALRSQTTLGIGAFKFFPIIKHVYGDIRLRGQVSFPHLQLYPFVRGLGFKNTLVRGYELNVIDGQHFAIFQSDWKYQFYNKIWDISRIIKWKQFNSVPIGMYARIFYDAAYVRNFHPELSKSKLSNRFLYGYGVGLDLVTFYETVLKVNYAVNQFGQNRLYFGVQRSL